MTHRRDFIKTMAAMTAALSVPTVLNAQNPNRDRLGEILPLRKLGKTGKYVTMLGVGGYHIGWTTEKDAQQVIETALAGGVRFFDTAEQYGPAISEERYGKYLTSNYRDLIFLMTKTQAKTAKDAEKHLDDSLRRMKTDYLDLWQMHSLFTPEDVDSRMNEKVLDVLIKAKESGKVKHIGFTGHQNPFAHKRMLELTKENDPIETVQMPVNVLDQSYFSFQQNVMPELLNRNIGLLAMKTLADGRFFAKKERSNWNTDDPIIPNYISIEEALFYVWSLPVSTIITGAENAEFMTEKIEMAKRFVKLNESERIALVEKVREKAQPGNIEYFKQKPA
ncbi:aldo/keto reductase [Sunxiuqinia sp. A32]|uniref:aldo/keto reductase n=1 Tax=Sunxiuqinia sp. A32 TaxID=3461496 RepID=UPI0040464B3A